jgi:hypothetical protein
MKKVLITGYFVSMVLLTFIAVKATATYKSGPVEVNFVNREHKLNDTEVAEHGWVKEENIDNIEIFKIKETRTKKLFGWDTKIDTLNIGFYTRKYETK